MRLTGRQRAVAIGTGLAVFAIIGALSGQIVPNPGVGGGGVNAPAGGGTTNTLAEWTGANALGNAGETDDGTTLTINRNTVHVGTDTLQQTLGTVISPTAIAGTVNDYNPTGLSTATVIYQATTAAVSLTGLAGGVDGRTITLCNTTSFGISVLEENGSSAAANRIRLHNTSTQLLTSAASTSSCMTLLYNGTLSRWVELSTASDSNDQLSFTGVATFTNNIVFSSNLTVQLTGHIKATGTAPTLSSCGTSPSITGSDVAATVTTGSATTVCTVTFAATYTTAPTCVITAEGTATEPTETISATAITFSTVIASTKYHYICIGH